VRINGSWIWLVAAAVLDLPFSSALPQEPVKLSTVITAFLPDSGVQTKRLPWITGDALPVTWQSAKPVAAADYLKNEELTLSRTGTAQASMGDGPTQEITVNVNGNDAGVQRVGVTMFPRGRPVGQRPLRQARRVPGFTCYGGA